MSVVYNSFIPQNIAPPDVKRISVYDSNGIKSGVISIPQEFRPATLGEKQYSFGAIADVHLLVSTAETDFTTALRYFKAQNMSFVCICGDMTNNGNNTQFAKYTEIVSANAVGMPVYAITGNHETYRGSDLPDIIEQYTGYPLYYSFECGNDVFIMLGIKSEGALFTDAELQWLYNTLETNRNKRCFIFQHCFLGNGNTATCGNAHGMYNNACWGGDNGQKQMQAFESLLKHYKNTVWFHGHSHLKFRFQTADCTYANFDTSGGFRSVHIPSITEPRVEDGSDTDTSPDYDYSASEGYVVDVYDGGVLLRGRDFISEKWIPVATYWIDTRLVDVPANTFTDSTGTINTNQQ